MMKKLLLIASMFVCALASAQSTMTITSTTISNLQGTQLASGQACLLATDNAGNAISLQAAGGGQIEHVAGCVTVTSGVMTLTAPNTAATNPSNPCLALTVTDTGSGPTYGQAVLDKGYECLQPSPSAYWCNSSTNICNLDNFIPSGMSGMAVVAGPQGSTGAPGTPLTFLGTFASAPSSPAIDNAYRDSTLGQTRVWTGSAWTEMNQDGATGATGPAVPLASTTPLSDGTASVGTSTTAARADHVHPSDTSRVPTATTVNGHALSANVVISASDLTTGTLPHAQLPTLVSGDIPANAANTTGTAASFTGSLAGDVTGTQSATTVSKINGGAVPVSANGLATDANGKPLTQTAHNQSVPGSCTTTNSGNAYSCTTSPTFTPAAGDKVDVYFNAMNTGAATLAVNGSSAVAIYKWGNTTALVSGDIQAGHYIRAAYDGSHWQLEGQLGNANATQVDGVTVPSPTAGYLYYNGTTYVWQAASAGVSVRQTVSTGPVDTNGLPTLFPSTSASLSITTQNVTSSVPFVATASQGFNASGKVDYVYQSTANLTWSSLTASTTDYLYVNASTGALGFTTLQPIYQFGGTPAVTSGQFTFNIGQMIGYLGNGTTAVATPIVFVGEVVTGTSTITSSTAYAYNGMYTSALQAMPVSSTALSLNHNLGVNASAISAKWTAVCTVSNLGYLVGDEYDVPGIEYSSSNGSYAYGEATRRLVALLVPNTETLPAFMPAAGGLAASITVADWNVRLYARRNF